MASRPRPPNPKLTRPKAQRMELTPLEPHLAALLNPALSEKKPKPTPKGFSEAGQSGFDSGPASRTVKIDSHLAQKLKLDAPTIPGETFAEGAETAKRPPRRRPASQNFEAPSGVSATAQSLQSLLEAGDPNFKITKPWVPHRPARPEKSEGGLKFKIVSEYEPKGDQPTAIAELVKGIAAQERDQVLLGVTGSGKTFTMAQVIKETQRPALILAPNKTLAAQLYGEFKSFFPDNAVEYFVSYYDYYQPEAYVPRSDTFIEKES